MIKKEEKNINLKKKKTSTNKKTMVKNISKKSNNSRKLSVKDEQIRNINKNVSNQVDKKATKRVEKNNDKYSEDDLKDSIIDSIDKDVNQEFTDELCTNDILDKDERFVDEKLDDNELDSLINKEFVREKRIKPRLKIRKKNKILIICVALVLIILLVASIFDKLFMPKIILKKGDISINYKEKYMEYGYKAIVGNKDITKKVKISGKVNSNKLGTYYLTYFVNNNGIKKSIKRKVVVKDLSKPEIKLSSLDDIYVCPGKKYEQEEFSAIDNYDGDISKNVKVTLKDDSITYKVSDKAGNKTSVTRNIIYKDKIAPSITLNGGEVVYYFIGDVYTDKGYSAVDNCDSDITKNVEVSGNVDTSKTGETILTYKVSDSAGNTTTVTRKVKVSERGKNGVIYLTFDDGPKSGTTNVILDILKEEGVKSTFFVTNGGPDDLIRREYDEGHSVALHTASHNYSLIYSSVDNYFNDLYSVQNRVKNITGYESHIIRFPGGGSNTVSRRYSNGIMSKLTVEVVNRGFKYYDWNISSGDAESGGHTSDEIYNNVVKSLSHNRVNMVLMHDIKTYTRDALKRIIEYGKNNGYTFEAISMDTQMVCQRVNN